MILSVFPKKDSPYIWIQYAARPGQKKRYYKTTIRVDDSHRKSKLEKELNRFERELLMADSEAAAAPLTGWDWVPGWISTRWGSSPQTLRVYRTQWLALAEYVEDAHIDDPRQFDRRLVFAYVDWRISQVKPKSGKNLSRNTALAELKMLAMVFDEAIQRGIVDTNPARKLGLARNETAIKPEITTPEQAIIEAALATAPDWMRLSFFIGIRTGLRFSNCNLNLGDVDWTAEQIVIERPKGGSRRAFAIPIYRSIRPELERMRKERQDHLYDIPPADADVPAIRWRAFLDKLGMAHLCFHCTRVTFVTRGMRGKIPETVMMKMVNHGSKLISRVYQRWTDDDVRRYAETLHQ